MVNKWPKIFDPKYHQKNLQEASFEILLSYFEAIQSSIKKSLQLIVIKGADIRTTA